MSDRVITYDASPGYLPHPYVPDRVRRVIPQTKLIVILRDPVERAWSQYRHNVKYGLEKSSFAEALEREKHLLIDENGEQISLERYNRDFENFTYAGRSFYLEQIERWLKRFPASQFLFLTTDAMERDPERIMQEVFEFLGVYPDVEIDLEPQRVDPEPYPIPAELQAVLARAYEPMNTALGEFLGPEFDWNNRYADVLEESGNESPSPEVPRQETPTETPETTAQDSTDSANGSGCADSGPAESGGKAGTELSALDLKDCVQPSVVASACSRQREPVGQQEPVSQEEPVSREKPVSQKGRSGAISIATLAAELRHNVQDRVESHEREGDHDPVRHRTPLSA